ncbi:MAG TPA: uroporphyrinogen decarboxylase family protein [Verrucomicrobiota bacterium]|nr:uroporphyrinogen decarboxylase family protein [Verrucomicrobiota bacterium]HNU51023.1 uroporphyrinogen decarboxylase family protein [Verrucomicrobiota bacterium]
MMTSRERVLTAFAHEEPDRVPRWCGASPEFLEKAKRQLGLSDTEALLVRFGDDFRRVHARYAGPAAFSPDRDLSPGAISRSPFGVERHGFGCGMPTSTPLAGATLRQVESYPWPDPGWMDVSRLREEALAWGGRYAILGGDWSPYWHDALDLLGMESLMIRMTEDPAVVDAVLGRVVDYYFEVSRRLFDAAADVIDVFFLGNDFGSRQGPLISPRAFDRFLLPPLRRLIGLGHDYGLKVQLHCCGGYEPLIPSMVAAGLDGLHAVQPGCRGMDLRLLKARYGDRILFNGAIDSQHVLIEGTPASVRQNVREVVSILAPGGGYVAGASHDYILEETPVENVVAMFDAIEEFGRYPVPSDPMRL